MSKRVLCVEGREHVIEYRQGIIVYNTRYTVWSLCTLYHQHVYTIIVYTKMSNNLRIRTSVIIT